MCNSHSEQRCPKPRQAEVEALTAAAAAAKEARVAADKQCAAIEKSLRESEMAAGQQAKVYTKKSVTASLPCGLCSVFCPCWVVVVLRMLLVCTLLASGKEAGGR